MQSRTVLLRLPEKLYADSRRLVKANGFTNIQELTRECLRKAVNDSETEAAIKRLRKLQGSVKNIKRLTEEERDKLYEKYLRMSEEERLQTLREFGLDKARKI